MGGVLARLEPGRRPPRATARDHKQRTIEEAEPVKPQRGTTVSDPDILQDSVRLISMRFHPL